MVPTIGPFPIYSVHVADLPRRSMRFGIILACKVAWSPNFGLTESKILRSREEPL